MKTATIVLAALLAAPFAAAADAPDGKSIYESKCQMCHDEHGAPKKMGEGAATLSEPKWQGAHSVDDIVKIVTDGKGKMKPYQDRLSAEEIKAVAGYVKTLK